MNHLAWTIGITVVACFALWLILFLLSLLSHSRFNWLQLINGADGPPSSSKFQVVLWTMIVIVAYIAIFVARWLKGEITISIAIPPSLLLLAGLSLGTAGGAKVLALRSGVSANPIAKDNTKGGLLADDSGQPDIGKFQLISWTLIAAAIFLVTLYQNLELFFGVITPPVGTTPPAALAFPTIDATLLTLLGVNQAVYLATKVPSAYFLKGSPGGLGGGAGQESDTALRLQQANTGGLAPAAPNGHTPDNAIPVGDQRIGSSAPEAIGATTGSFAASYAFDAWKTMDSASVGATGSVGL